MRGIISYLFAVMLVAVLGSCGDDGIVNLQEAESVITDSAFISCNVETMNGLRGLKPQKTENNEETAMDSKGEKGRDRRDGNDYLSEKFDASAPPAQLKVVYSIGSDCYVMKLVFGKNYRQEEIEYAFDGRTLGLRIFNEENQKIDEYILDNYHLGDVFYVQSESLKSGSTIQLLTGYFTGAFWYVGEQSFEALFY